MRNVLLAILLFSSCLLASKNRSIECENLDTFLVKADENIGVNFFNTFKHANKALIEAERESDI